MTSKTNPEVLKKWRWCVELADGRKVEAGDAGEASAAAAAFKPRRSGKEENSIHEEEEAFLPQRHLAGFSKGILSICKQHGVVKFKMKELAEGVECNTKL